MPAFASQSFRFLNIPRHRQFQPISNSMCRRRMGQGVFASPISAWQWRVPYYHLASYVANRDRSKLPLRTWFEGVKP
jgi:hypothetical protein